MMFRIAVAALLLVVAGFTPCYPSWTLECHLRPDMCTPVTPSEGSGYIQVEFPAPGESIDSLLFVVNYVHLSGTVTGLELYRGSYDSDEVVLYTLVDGHFPYHHAGTMKGWDWEDPIDLGRDRFPVIITTDAFPDGEICGQLYPPMPVQKTSWGAIRGLYR